MIPEFLALFLTVLSIVYYLSVRRPRNFPKGPNGWPVVGCLFDFEIPRHLKYIKWGQQYGDIFGFYLGHTPTIVLNNYKDFKEAFANNVFSGRLQSEPIKARCLGGTRGVLFSEGKVWSEQRRFSLKNLKDFGLGRKSMETAILEEVSDLVSAFKKEVGKPMQTQNRFNIAVLNVLWSITSGERINHDDPRLNEILRSLSTVIVKRPLSSIMAEDVPLVHYLRQRLPFFFNTSSKKMQNAVLDYVNEAIKHHKESLQEDSLRDFIDVYLKEINMTTDPHSSFHKFEGEQNLRVVMLDLFLAGAETTSNTLSWTFLIMALNPNKQEKLFEDIKRVVGLSRPVSLTDKPQLPYLEASIFEIQRFASLVPLITHNVLEDVDFRGYTFPKGANIVANLYTAMRDEKAWGDPDNFRPERFLSSDGKTTIRNEAWLPFGTGKRVCLGETLARDELFLFAGNLLQQFQITTVPGEPKPTLDCYASGVLVPKPHRLILIDRSTSSAM